MFFVVLLLLLVRESDCQSNSSSVLTSSTLRSAIVSKSGNVIVSDDNTVYLLNGDLSEVIQMDRNEGQSPEGMTLTRDEGRLVVCWANSVTSGGQLVNTAPCSIYNSSTLDVLVNVTLPASTGVGAPRGNRYSVSRGFTGGSGETFFVMSGLLDCGVNNRLYHREHSVSNGNVERYEMPNVEGSDLTSRTYHSGITVGNYTYIVADDVESSDDRVRVIRLCDGIYIGDSWYEVQLICGTVSGTLSDFGSELLDANFLTVEDGASEAMLLVTVESEEGSSDTCSFPLSSIDSTARGLLQYCQSNSVTLPFPWISSNIGECGSSSITECDLIVPSGIPGIIVGPGRLSTQVTNNPPSQIQPLHVETPLNSFSSTVLSSSEVFLVDGAVVMFAGLSTGEVRKYTAVNFTANEIDPSPERTWSLSSSVKSLTYSRGSDYVYAVTETTIYRLPVEECSNFTDCSSCTTSGGKLCGWCSVENKCSRSSQCANSSRSLRWIQASGQCSTKSISVDLSQLDPTSMLVTTSRTSAISPTLPSMSPPPLPTPSPVPMPTRCDHKAREFVNLRQCSAGVDIRTALVLAQPLTACEYQLFYSRFCQLQKCMDSLVDLLQVCFSEAGMDKQNSSVILDNAIPLHSKLFCGWDRERKDFCGVMFPEFITLEPLTFNLTCAIQGSTCSSTCRMIVSSAIDHYGCCLNQFLKLRLKVDVNRFYKRCGVTPPDRCRTKLKDPRKE